MGRSSAGAGLSQDRQGWVAGLWRNRSLIFQMIEREVVGRYRGSVFGLLWSFITPVVMLAIYTFVFGVVFKARWTGSEETSVPQFAILLFAGLIVHAVLAEIIGRAPTVVLGNVSYVKKVVFPLEILPMVALGSALFHAFASVVVLIGFQLVAVGKFPPTLFLFPVVLAPFAVLMLGIGWFLASLGVYFRDVNQILGPLVTALLFLSPVLYPVSALPESIRSFVFLNPLTFIIEQTRNVLIWGQLPDWFGLGVYTIVAIIVAAAGLWWFQMTRKGFADVL